MKEVHNLQCDHCKKAKEDLYAISAYWVPVSSNQNMGTYRQMKYNENDKRTVVYLIGKECVEKRVKLEKYGSAILFGLLFFATGAAPFLSLIGNGGESSDPGGMFMLGFVSIMFLVAMFVFIFSKHEKLVKPTLHKMVLKKLERDLINLIDSRLENVPIVRWTEIRKPNGKRS